MPLLKIQSNAAKVRAATGAGSPARRSQRAGVLVRERSLAFGNRDHGVRRSRRALFLLLGLVLGAEPALLRAQDRPGTESGVFVIRSSGRRIGTERFLIRRSASGVEAEGELDLDPPDGSRVSETCTLKLDGKLKPTSYERQQQTPKKGTLTVQFGATETRLLSIVGSETQEQIFLLPDHDLVVLDTNFFQHYKLLLRQ